MHVLIGINNKLIILEGKGHALDHDMNDVNVQTVFIEVINFFKKHLV